MDPWFHAGGRLFIGAVPEPGARTKIARLIGILKRAHGFAGSPIKAECLHVSLLFLGSPSEDLVRVAHGAFAEVRMPRFDVTFDHTVSFRGRPGSRPFVLAGCEGSSSLTLLRRELIAASRLKHLARRDFTPHITLWYGEGGISEHPIEPIGWTVREFVLIHSLNGHTHLARWPLGV